MVSASDDGPTVFKATVDTMVCGMYALVWPDGEPVGIPFTRKSLKVVS